MRSILLGSLLALVLPAVAGARVRTVAPPGNSGVSQYVESIPTARGSRPSTTVHPVGGVLGGPGGGGGGGGSASGGGLSQSTQPRLAQQGRESRAAAALARATAPTTRRLGTPGHPIGNLGASGHGHSPPAAVLKALTGSAASGGLGALLPIILVIGAIGAGAFAIRRRRRTT